MTKKWKLCTEYNRLSILSLDKSINRDISLMNVAKITLRDYIKPPKKCDGSAAILNTLTHTYLYILCQLQSAYWQPVLEG